MNQNDKWFERNICIVMMIEKTTGKPANPTSHEVFCRNPEITEVHCCKFCPRREIICKRKRIYKSPRGGCSGTWSGNSSWENCPSLFSMDEINTLLKQGLTLQDIFNNQIDIRNKLNKRLKFDLDRMS